jgi:hypothetical protein
MVDGILSDFRIWSFEQNRSYWRATNALNKEKFTLFGLSLIIGIGWLASHPCFPLTLVKLSNDSPVDRP